MAEFVLNFDAKTHINVRLFSYSSRALKFSHEIHFIQKRRYLLDHVPKYEIAHFKLSVLWHKTNLCKGLLGIVLNGVQIGMK